MLPTQLKLMIIDAFIIIIIVSSKTFLNIVTMYRAMYEKYATI